ncbi:hypothetical protein VCV18_012695 [Metarhizium anisopliae]
MNTNVNTQSLGANYDASKNMRAALAMDAFSGDTCISQNSRDPRTTSTRQSLNPYFDINSADISEQAMDALRIVSEDLGPAGRWIVESVLRPLCNEIWEKLYHYKEYCMSEREIQVFLYFELEYPENERAFIEAAKRRAWLKICQDILNSCPQNGHISTNCGLCDCLSVKNYLRDLGRYQN